MTNKPSDKHNKYNVWTFLDPESNKLTLRRHSWALAGVDQLVGALLPHNRTVEDSIPGEDTYLEVVSSIPGPGMNGRQPIDISLSH